MRVSNFRTLATAFFQLQNCILREMARRVSASSRLCFRKVMKFPSLNAVKRVVITERSSVLIDGSMRGRGEGACGIRSPYLPDKSPACCRPRPTLAYLMKLNCLLILSSTGFFLALKATLLSEIRLLPLVSIEMMSGPNSLTRLIHNVSGMPRSGHS